ncbi:MAG: hypothetical protein WC916_02435 [Candidatus Woesearchaeota archaeon]
MIEEKVTTDIPPSQEGISYAPGSDSEIYRLLKKNTNPHQELTKTERAKALDFILNPIYAVDAPACWLCKPNSIPAIYDLNICKDHAFYALCTRK